MQELTTGHYEDGELSDPEQDTSVNDPDQSSVTGRQCGVYALIWDGYAYRTLTLIHPELKTTPLLQPNKSQWVKLVSPSQLMTGCAENGRFEPETYARIPVVKFRSRGSVEGLVC